MTNIRGISVSIAPFVILAVLFASVTGPGSALLSQYLGASALVAMGLSHLIATRARIVELMFGPLDKAYVLHKWLGIGALVAALLHDNIGAEIKALGRGSALNDFAEGLGEQSLNGLIVLLAITLMTFIPYRIWYWTHRAMGICFVAGAVHYALILKPFSVFDPVGVFILGFCIIGVTSYLYNLLPRSWRSGYQYEVTSIEKTAHAYAISLKPKNRSLHHRSGQFAFFTFDVDGLRENHPFSISDTARPDGSVRITVANLGDFTARIGRALEVGTSVEVHGPYGRFFPAQPSKPQVWIAGGIGITPFLAWLEGIETEGAKIDLIYTFRGVVNAPHLADVKLLIAQNDRVTLHLFDTAKGSRVTVEALEGIIDFSAAKVSYCGPSALLEALRSSKRMGRIHSEVFEIRTGFPFLKAFRKIIFENIRWPLLKAVK